MDATLNICLIGCNACANKLEDTQQSYTRDLQHMSRFPQAVPVWICPVHVVALQHMLRRHHMLCDKRPHAAHDVRRLRRRVET